MIDKYRQAFQEEARELLAELESALLELDQKRGDQEVVGRAFRALHTIKGSGAMFGFDDIAGVAHNLEAAFDRLRKGELAVSTSLINLALAAGDQIKTMLDASAENGVTGPERAAEILGQLRELTEGPATAWHIHFRPGPDVLLNGTNPLVLLRQLEELGQARIRVDTSAIPRLAEMDPERCYLAWDIVLTTTAPVEAIRDVFIFIEGECELAVEPANGPLPAAPQASKAQVPELPGTPAPAVPAAQVSGANKASIRVSAEKLDQLVNLVGELVTVQARLSEVAGRLDDADILDISEAVDRLTAALRENSMSIRMLPLKPTFDRFRRLVHDLGVELNKEVELTVEGADTELDKTVIDQLNDPLVHLVRNAMDHGIETPEERRVAGKKATARIHLSAHHAGAHVLIRVADDGRGVNAEAVRARAIEQGLIDADARLSEEETFALIMAPGFSTARQVTDVSGRGVGMDVVRRSIEGLRGSVEIASRTGAGTTVTLRLPLTLAIIDGLLVRVGQAHFVVPLANSLECMELTSQDIEDAHGRHIVNVRGEVVPYIRLREYFLMEAPRPDREQIMLVETEQGHYGFVVDQVLGDHQTVIKNLGRLYRNAQVVSGATILGNGSVALILDPHRLVQNVLQTTAQNRRFGGGAGRQSFKKENRIDAT
ncbi:MAG: chemotaxis protein CheA [Candidatus Sulfopaludibacter sp.]|nr:chemotaxis protein CheA [Candidatus Sulfopaludibacter sp.]